MGESLVPALCSAELVAYALAPFVRRRTAPPPEAVASALRPQRDRRFRSALIAARLFERVGAGGGGPRPDMAGVHKELDGDAGDATHGLPALGCLRYARAVTTRPHARSPRVLVPDRETRDFLRFLRKHP